MSKYLRLLSFLFFITAVLCGCSSPTVYVTSQPPTSTAVMFYDAKVDLASLQWMEPLALQDGLDLNLSGVYALTKDVAFLYGGLGVTPGTLRSVLLRTENGGANWTEVMQPVVGSDVQQVLFADDRNGWALVEWTVESSGPLLLYHTEDGGKTWARLSEVPKESTDASPVQVKFNDAKTGQIVMMYDAGLPETNRIAFLTTTDGGATWQETRSIPLGEPTWQGKATVVAPYELNLYESTGKDGSDWKIELGQLNNPVTVSRQLPGQNVWSVVSVIARQWKYSNGRVQ